MRTFSFYSIKLLQKRKINHRNSSKPSIFYEAPLAGIFLLHFLLSWGFCCGADAAASAPSPTLFCWFSFSPVSCRGSRWWIKRRRPGNYPQSWERRRFYPSPSAESWFLALLELSEEGEEFGQSSPGYFAWDSLTAQGFFLGWKGCISDLTLKVFSVSGQNRVASHSLFFVGEWDPRRIRAKTNTGAHFPTSNFNIKKWKRWKIEY